MESLRVRKNKLNVEFIREGTLLFSLPWQDADTLGDSLRNIFNGVNAIETVTPQVLVQLKQGGVHVFYKGQLTLDLPMEVVKEVFRAVKLCTRECEALQEIHNTIRDQAYLLRGGAPFGLVTDDKVLKEAVKEALWETSIRKYIPMRGVYSKATFGRPNLIGGEINKWVTIQIQ